MFIRPTAKNLSNLTEEIDERAEYKLEACVSQPRAGEARTILPS